jgi:putative DNA primase/helicase
MTRDELDFVPPPKEPAAVARAIVDRLWRRQNDGVLLLRYWRGGFWRWEVTHWIESERTSMLAQLYRSLETAAWEDAKGQPQPWSPNRHRIADVVEATQALTFTPETVDPPAWVGGVGSHSAHSLVSCRNGLLHIPSRKLLAHDPKFFNRVSVPFDYLPDAPPPKRWLEFLESLWDDEESIEALAEFFGYVLSGDTSLHRILLLVGPTRAGKGVIARVLAALVGTKNVSGPTLASLATNFGLAPLVGKSLAVISDARLAGPGTHLVVERLLTVSGEDTVTVDRKFREPWTGKLGARFLIISNELPCFGDSSRAIARRFIVLLLRNTWLGQENPRLTNELLEELPGILNWALDGLDRLHRHGCFTEPAASREAIVALEDLASPVAAFVRDLCEVGPAKTVAVEAIFNAWRNWCEEQGQLKPGSAQVFGRNLRAVVPVLRIVSPRADDGRQYRHYQGIALSGARNREVCASSRVSGQGDPLTRSDTRTNSLRAQVEGNGRAGPEVAAFLRDQELLG